MRKCKFIWRPSGRCFDLTRGTRAGLPAAHLEIVPEGSSTSKISKAKRGGVWREEITVRLVAHRNTQRRLQAFTFGVGSKERSHHLVRGAVPSAARRTQPWSPARCPRRKGGPRRRVPKVTRGRAARKRRVSLGDTRRASLQAFQAVPSTSSCEGRGRSRRCCRRESARGACRRGVRTGPSAPPCPCHSQR